MFKNGKTVIRSGYSLNYDLPNFATLHAPQTYLTGGSWSGTRSGFFTQFSEGIYSVDQFASTPASNQAIFNAGASQDNLLCVVFVCMATGVNIFGTGTGGESFVPDPPFNVVQVLHNFKTPMNHENRRDAIGAIQGVKQFSPPWLSILITVLAETGLRVRKEALPLKWNDVDLGSEPGCIRVRDSKTAAGVRSVWLTKHCRNTLIQWREFLGPGFSECVFPSPRIPSTHITDYKKAWQKAAREAGIPDRRIYDLRASFASMANAWTQDGKDIVYSSTRGGLVSLWRVRGTGGEPQPVPGVSAMAFHPSIPRKGNFLAYQHATLTNSIWSVKLKSKTQAFGSATRLIAARGVINYRPNFSPDGKKVVFESDRLGYSDIWSCDSDGSNCTQLTSMHGTAGTARWSPDGHHVVFEFQSRHYYEIYVMDVPGGRPRLLTTFPESDNGAPNWSHDGKWIYFYSSHEKGPIQLWKVPFEGGRPIKVTNNGGVYGIESEDGRFLYFSKLEQPGIWKMSLIDGREEQVLDHMEGCSWPSWALSPTGIYFIHSFENGQGRLEYFNFHTHTRTPIDTVEKQWFGLALAPDGKSLLYSRNETDESEIMLVKNFQ